MFSETQNSHSNRSIQTETKMGKILLLSNPRSGSTYLLELLNSHPEVNLIGEILSSKNNLLPSSALSVVQNKLSEMKDAFTGFKLFPEQVYAHKLHFETLCSCIGATHVILLWRENPLETFVSRRIAYSTKSWYSYKKPEKVNKITVDPKDFEGYICSIKTDWKRIASEWPVDAKTIFVKYEDLLEDPSQEVKRIFSELSLDSVKEKYTSFSQRQNPAPLFEKVINYYELPNELLQAKLDVHQILMTRAGPQPLG